MGFIKTARLRQVCGDCSYFDLNKKLCVHPEMKKVEINANSIHKCDSKYFKSKDDYESAGR